MLSARGKTLSNIIQKGYSLGKRNYGLPASAIGLGTDPRKDKTVQLTPLRGVNIIHDPLLSKGNEKEGRLMEGISSSDEYDSLFRYCLQYC
jgi:hypothetical protein